MVSFEKEPDLLSFNIVTDKRRYILTAENAECYGNWSNALEPKKVKATPTKAQRQKLGCGTVLFDFKPQSGETHQLGVSAGKGAIDRPKTMGCSSGGAWGNAATLV